MDLLVESGERLALVEVKSGRTYASDWSAGLARMRRLAANATGLVVYGGNEGRPTGEFPVFAWHEAAAAANFALGGEPK